MGCHKKTLPILLLLAVNPIVYADDAAWPYDSEIQPLQIITSDSDDYSSLQCYESEAGTCTFIAGNDMCVMVENKSSIAFATVSLLKPKSDTCADYSVPCNYRDMRYLNEDGQTYSKFESSYMKKGDVMVIKDQNANTYVTSCQYSEDTCEKYLYHITVFYKNYDSSECTEGSNLSNIDPRIDGKVTSDTTGTAIFKTIDTSSGAPITEEDCYEVDGICHYFIPFESCIQVENLASETNVNAYTVIPGRDEPCDNGYQSSDNEYTDAIYAPKNSVLFVSDYENKNLAHIKVSAFDMSYEECDNVAKYTDACSVNTEIDYDVNPFCYYETADGSVGNNCIEDESSTLDANYIGTSEDDTIATSDTVNNTEETNAPDSGHGNSGNNSSQQPQGNNQMQRDDGQNNPLPPRHRRR